MQDKNENEEDKKDQKTEEPKENNSDENSNKDQLMNDFKELMEKEELSEEDMNQLQSIFNRLSGYHTTSKIKRLWYGIKSYFAFLVLFVILNTALYGAFNKLILLSKWYYLFIYLVGLGTLEYLLKMIFTKIIIFAKRPIFSLIYRSILVLIAMFFFNKITDYVIFQDTVSILIYFLVYKILINLMSFYIFKYWHLRKL